MIMGIAYHVKALKERQTVLKETELHMIVIYCTNKPYTADSQLSFHVLLLDLYLGPIPCLEPIQRGSPLPVCS